MARAPSDRRKPPVDRTAKRSAGYPLLLFVGHVCMLLNLFFALPDFISERLHIHFRFLRFGKNLLFLLSDVMVHVLTKNGEFRVIQFFVGCHLLQLANELPSLRYYLSADGGLLPPNL